jgi:hypothetical protein
VGTDGDAHFLWHSVILCVEHTSQAARSRIAGPEYLLVRRRLLEGALFRLHGTRGREVG